MAASYVGIACEWEACAVLQFVHIFGRMLFLEPLERSELETCLNDPHASRKLCEIQWRLLMGGNIPCPQDDSWFEELRRLIGTGIVLLDDELRARVEALSYDQLEPRERLRVCLSICEAAAPECDVGEPTLVGDTSDAMVRMRARRPRARGAGTATYCTRAGVSGALHAAAV
jgi:hypothetical protein